MQRRLQLIILAHIWALVPVALLWLTRPDWRGPLAPSDVRELTWLARADAAYILLRTWLTLSGRLGTARVWPFIDVALVAAALLVLRSPTDPLSTMYFIPLASAVASLDSRHLATVTGAAAGSYVAVIVYSLEPWTISLAYRLVFILLMASLYAGVIRVVTDYARTAERAEYQTALAREIHDGIQHFLVTMGARLDLAGHLVREDPDRAGRIIGEERQTLRAASDELRYLVRRLRSAAGADLAAALRNQIAATAERWPFTLEVDIPDRMPHLAADAEHAILRVIQEGLTNAAKHARASSVEVAVMQVDGEVRCRVRDDGAGFDGALPGAGGLAGLRGRVQEAGGRLEVESHPGGGTTLTAAFPLRGDRR
ncbi:MAG TPA: ATP-binding protein [Gemmatimonadales bacterium]|nr:ATP-binding protein [Gemmatimonadales bacterium]